MNDHEARFRALYSDHVDAILGFALRRVDRPEDAADVVADTFLVAWRRLAHVPPEPETRPWLYGTARRVLANQRRGDHRRLALGGRLREQLRGVVPDPADGIAVSADVAIAMERLSGRDQEVLRLHLWEGLEPREIADVLGLTTVVVRPRLSRARARLREQLDRNAADPPGHLPSDRTKPSRPDPVKEEQYR